MKTIRGIDMKVTNDKQGDDQFIDFLEEKSV